MVMKATEILNRAWDFISGSTLSCTEACLLLFLMNESGYSDKPFPCTNVRIMGTLNINKGLLYRARNSLRDLGIISYSIGNRRSSVPTYGIPLKTMIEWERREPKTGPKTGLKTGPKKTPISLPLIRERDRYSRSSL